MAVFLAVMTVPSASFATSPPDRSERSTPTPAAVIRALVIRKDEATPLKLGTIQIAETLSGLPLSRSTIWVKIREDVPSLRVYSARSIALVTSSSRLNSMEQSLSPRGLAIWMSAAPRTKGTSMEGPTKGAPADRLRVSLYDMLEPMAVPKGWATTKGASPFLRDTVFFQAP